jgi:hypothetical protein
MAITLVTGQVAVGEASGTSVTATLPNNPTTGNLVVALWSDGSSSPGTVAVKDSAGTPNVYTATTLTPFVTTGSTHGGSATGNTLGINYLLSAPASATKTITLTKTGTQLCDLWAAEFTGGTFSFDKDATGVDAGASTTINTPSLTPTHVAELLVAANFLSGAVTSANSPWTEISTIPASGSGAEYTIKGAADSTAQAVGWTVSSSTWAAISAAFSISAAATCIKGSLPLLGVGCGIWAAKKIEENPIVLRRRLISPR